MSLIRKHVAVLQAWACLALVTFSNVFFIFVWTFITSVVWTWQRDFEPMTGFMWRDATRYQLNVAVDDRLVGLIQRGTRKMSLSYVRQPLPLYWVEKSSTINAAGVDDFYSRVCIRFITIIGATFYVTAVTCHHHFFKVEFAIFQSILSLTIFQF